MAGFGAGHPRSRKTLRRTAGEDQSRELDLIRFRVQGNVLRRNPQDGRAAVETVVLTAVLFLEVSMNELSRRIIFSRE
jgi:hypothetical protein